jgi:hypothetical protein
VVSDEVAQAADQVPRLATVYLPLNTPTSAGNHSPHRLWGEVDEVTWEIKSRPIAPEQSRAEAGGVGNLDDDKPAWSDPSEHLVERAEWIGKVFDDVEGGHEVEALLGERRIGGIAHEDLRGDLSGLRRGLLIEFYPGDVPSDRLHLPKELTSSATNVEQTPLTDPRRERFQNTPPAVKTASAIDRRHWARL